ncbi:MAG: hypothetical protein F4X44_02220 [Gammaproteobacteria bacterium]|nr:hypothetical protein [Gammaproteobacteria bacterium]MYD79411.1 hypothetical protein [Gammaproteobacteria bacterium]
MKSLVEKRKLSSHSSVVCSLLLLLFASNAWACKCKFPTVEEDFLNSDVVLSGKVLRIDSVADERRIKWDQDDFLQTVEVELELNEAWKGTDETRVTVLTALDEPSCGYDFSVGARYVVFARARKSGSGAGSSDIEALYTNLCSANHELGYDRASEALLKQLEELRTEIQQESELEQAGDAEEQEE